MPSRLSTNELLDRYLSGAITAPEEAELERRAETDPVVAEAMAGLYAFPEVDHAARTRSMTERARAQVQGKPKKAKVRGLRRWAAVAAGMLILAVAVFLLPRIGDLPEGDLAMATESAPTEAADAPEPTAIPAEPLPEPEPLAPEGPNDFTSNDPAPSTSSAPERPSARSSEEPRPQVAEPPAVMIEEAEDEIIAETVGESSAVVPVAPPPPPADIAPVEPLAAPPVSARKRVDSPSPPEDEVAGNAAATNAERARYVTGTVTDENGNPIPGALVRLPGLPLGERTDTNGVFRLAADATLSRLEISHPGFEEETVEVSRRQTDLQLTLEARDTRREEYEQAWAPVKIDMGSGRPGYALPEEGYNALRRRLEAGRPEELPAGKYRFSFVVNPDGTLEDFVFRGVPPQEVMDYLGGTIVRTSIWNVVQGEEPVRVYFKVVFE